MAVVRRTETKLKGNIQDRSDWLFQSSERQNQTGKGFSCLRVCVLHYSKTRGFGGSLHIELRVIEKGSAFERRDVMDETNLEDKLNELVREFGDAADPQHKKLADLAKQAQVNRQKLEKSISNLQESLDYLRVCIKYQVFDLEATRRENEYLRKLLDENNS
jgi:hypothetical protein